MFSTISPAATTGADASLRTPAGASALELLPAQRPGLQAAQDRLQKFSKGKAAGTVGTSKLATAGASSTQSTANAAAARQVIRSSVNEPQQPAAETPLERFQSMSSAEKRRKVRLQTRSPRHAEAPMAGT